MNTFWKVLSGVWDFLQILLAFAINAFFLLPNSLVGGKEVVRVLDHAVPIEGEVFGIGIFHFELWLIVGALAIVYDVIGFIQAAYVPRDQGWIRGANWAASVVVLVPILWVWYRIISDNSYQLTVFQLNGLYLVTFVVILDVCMDLLLPAIGNVAKKIVDVTKTI